MEYSIHQLLDALQEVDVDIQPNTCASANRIKELTMKKMHSENKRKYRSLSSLTKVLLAAAVLASLALPVMAATQFGFTDWLAGLFQPGQSYDSDLALGSASKSWEVSGWVVELSAEDVTDQGMTVVCRHNTNETQPQSGTLAAEEGYWIESWNGTGYEKLPQPQQEIPAGKTIRIQADAAARWETSWKDTYGSLAPGSYRLGKNFLYTAEDGTQETVPHFVKFRVYSQEMAPVIAQCRAKLEALKNRDSYHIVETGYTELAEHDYYVIEYWKDGEDYLIERRYMMNDGTLKQRDGFLLRDGKGYALTWEGDTAQGSVAAWESVDWLDESQRDAWALCLEIYDSNVGQVTGDGTTTRIVSGISFSDGREQQFTELTFVLNAQGELAFAKLGQIPGMEYQADQVKAENLVEVQNTAPSEIVGIIRAQKVD